MGKTLFNFFLVGHLAVIVFFISQPLHRRYQCVCVCVCVCVGGGGGWYGGETWWAAGDFRMVSLDFLDLGSTTPAAPADMVSRLLCITAALVFVLV